MIPLPTVYGKLPPGEYLVEWPEFYHHFATNPWRTHLLTGMRAALLNFKQAGCDLVYIDGSFVTPKIFPNDYDACWIRGTTDLKALDPVFFDFDDNRKAQRLKYYGEFFPAEQREGGSGRTFLNFFQYDTNGDAKGILGIYIGTIT